MPAWSWHRHAFQFFFASLVLQLYPRHCDALALTNALAAEGEEVASAAAAAAAAKGGEKK